MAPASFGAAFRFLRVVTAEREGMSDNEEDNDVEVGLMQFF